MNNKKLGKDFTLLFYGQLVSQLGTHCFNIARIYWLVDIVKKGSYVGSLLMLCSFVFTFASPIGGVLADKINRKSIIILTDVLSGLSMIFLAAMMIVDVDITIKIIALFISSMFVSFSNAMFTPAVSASLPSIVTNDQLKAANSKISGAGQFAQILGQGAGGWVLVFLSAPLMFFINGISFILSAISESFIDFKSPSQKKIKDINVIELFNYKKSFFSGWDIIKGNSLVKRVLFFQSAMAFLRMPIFVLAPYLAKEAYLGGPQEYGYIIGAFSVGMFIGFSNFSRIARLNSKLRIFDVFAILHGISFIFVGVVSNLYAGIASFIIIGVTTAFTSVELSTFVQKSYKSELLGRVMGLSSLIRNFTIPFSFIISGFAVDIFGGHAANVFSILGVFQVAIIIYFLSRNSKELNNAFQL